MTFVTDRELAFLTQILISVSNKCTVYNYYIIRWRLRWHSYYKAKPSNQKYEKGQSLPSDLKLTIIGSFAAALFKTYLMALILGDRLVIPSSFGFWGLKQKQSSCYPVCSVVYAYGSFQFTKNCFLLWHSPSSVFKKIVPPNSPSQYSSCEASCYL